MLTFDARFTLRLTTKGDRRMSDQWIQGTAKRIRDAEAEKKRREDFEMMRERKLSNAGLDMFTELRQHLKDAVAKLNEHLKEKRLTLGRNSYDEIEVEGGRDASLCLKFDDDAHRLEVDMSSGSHSQTKQVRLDFDEASEVRFIYEDRPVTTQRFAEILLDALIDLELAEQKPSRRFSLDEDV